MNDTVSDGYFVGFKLLVMNVSDSDGGYARFNLLQLVMDEAVCVGCYRSVKLLNFVMHDSVNDGYFASFT